MKYAPFVCLIALSLTASPRPRASAQTPGMTKGVSVEMAQTKTAAAYPAADNADAWIVAVTADGHLFFGAKSVTPEQLFDEMKATPRNRDAKLYVKADARSTFSSLKSALGPARSVQFEEIVLLTSQSTPAPAGGIVSPQGIGVRLMPQRKEGKIEVRLLSHGHESALTVNGKSVAWSELESTLKNLVRSPNQVVELECDDTILVSELIRVMDEARKTGAAAALPIFHSL